MDYQKLDEYARLLVVSGLAVKANQLVVIRASLEARDLVRLVTKYAFEIAKAKDVIVKYTDDEVEHMRYQYRDVDSFCEYPSYESAFFNDTANANACYLTLESTNPDLMNDIDPKKMGNASRARNQACMPWRVKLNTMQCQWCIACVPSKEWALKVYPDADNPEEALWDAIFKVCRVNGNAIENWDAHKHSFLKKMDIINSMQIESMHYTNSLGTDFTCRLPENYFFLGGGSYLQDGGYCFPNIPTEELFAAPDRLSCNGKLVASMPLVHNGSMIEDFWFEFKDGKVVDYDARVGKDVIQSILDTDENASYLGEFALVPYDSPISNLNTLFYSTLFDENAACHFALGRAYSESIVDGINLSDDELLARGLNISLSHVDFMIGTKDLMIEAKCKDGSLVKIFENGNFTPLFD